MKKTIFSFSILTFLLGVVSTYLVICTVNWWKNYKADHLMVEILEEAIESKTEYKPHTNYERKSNPPQPEDRILNPSYTR